MALTSDTVSLLVGLGVAPLAEDRMLKKVVGNPTKWLVSGLLLVGVIAVSATGAVPAGAPVDEPMICPYCGGAFSFEGLGIEFSRELGLRALLACITP
jgi:hypothetical protein